MLAQIMISTNLDFFLLWKSLVVEIRTMKSKIPNKKIETKETTRAKTTREITLDVKLLKVSVMILGKNKSSKIHNTAFII
jgi:hypothetical protein